MAILPVEPELANFPLDSPYILIACPLKEEEWRESTFHDGYNP